MNALKYRSSAQEEPPYLANVHVRRALKAQHLLAVRCNDLCACYLTSFDCLDQFGDLPAAAACSHQQITRRAKVNTEE